MLVLILGIYVFQGHKCLLYLNRLKGLNRRFRDSEKHSWNAFFTIVTFRGSNFKEASFYVHLGFRTIHQCCRSAIVSMPIRIRINLSMQTLINGAKPTRIHADLDPVRLCRHKFEFLLKNIGITKWVIDHKAYLHRYKSLSQISGLFVSF